MTRNPVALGVRFLLVAACFGLCGCSAFSPALRHAPEGSALLFDVTFSAPEQAVGTDVKVAGPDAAQRYPSRVPSGILFGHPTVLGKFCGLDEQPVQLKVPGIRAMEGLEFQFQELYGRYHVELDLCVEGLDPAPMPAEAVQVIVFLDLPEAHAFGLVSGGDLVVMNPTRRPETIDNPLTVGKFEPGKPIHLAFDVDIEKQIWTIAVDGKTVYDAPVRVTMPVGVRLLARGNTATAAGFDNVWIWAEHHLRSEREQIEPEPTTAGPESSTDVN